MKWFKHAFAVDQGAFEPTDLQREVVRKLSDQVAKRHLTTPALAFLELSRPLNYVASQTMQFFMPIVKIITDAQGVQAFADMLEHRGSIEFICREIEAAEARRAKKGTPSKHDPQETE